jgi:excisionase family DNA binding protein
MENNVCPFLRSNSETHTNENKFDKREISGLAIRKNPEPLFFENLEWMTSRGAAQYLGKSVGALRVMVHRGRIPARKFFRRLYFKKSELDCLLESSSRNGGRKWE